MREITVHRYHAVEEVEERTDGGWESILMETS